ncbi:hypothetical protein WR25_04439 [Diploscapter pachys]|uniref:Calponin-homology (CH) domain-containing protein n=1 Tax=Diploscapter pachys TaxID=2018661 RepID=A0A2A2LGF3_9BILA|nr:hypothetical protein WR25_04439 [Diploscapter pachys]
MSVAGTPASVSKRQSEAEVGMQFEDFCVWMNTLLKADGGYEEIDLNKVKDDATKLLAESMSSASSSKRQTTQKQNSQGKETKEGGQGAAKNDQLRKFINKHRIGKRELGRRLLNETDLKTGILNLIASDTLSFKDDCSVYSDHGLQASLLTILWSIHPVWLHLALEIVFAEEVPIDTTAPVHRTLGAFISKRLFIDPSILGNRKYTGGNVSLVHPAGRKALHSHFLQHLCLLLCAVDIVFKEALFPQVTRMFTRFSKFKCLDDVLNELTRLILSGKSLSLKKALYRIGFSSTYKQASLFLVNFCKEIKLLNFPPFDMEKCDMFRKLVELVFGLPRGEVIRQLRSPQGDLIRKRKNVEQVLNIIGSHEIDVKQFKPDDICLCRKARVCDLLLRLIGLQIQSKVDTKVMIRWAIRLKDSGYMQDTPLPKDENALTILILRQLAQYFGIQISGELDKDKIGSILGAAWNDICPNQPNFCFIIGDSAYDKIVTVAEQDLELSVGCRKFPLLFARLILSRLCEISEKRRKAATVIQRAWRRFRYNLIRGPNIDLVAGETFTIASPYVRQVRCALRNVLLNTQHSTPNVAGQKDSVDRKIFQFNLQLSEWEATEFGSPSSDKENRTVNGEGRSALAKKWRPLEEDNTMQASGGEGDAQAEQTEENDKTVVNQRNVTLASKDEGELSDIDEEEETQTVAVAESEGEKIEGRVKKEAEERFADEGTETAVEIDAQHRTVFSVQLPNLDPNEISFILKANLAVKEEEPYHQIEQATEQKTSGRQSDGEEVKADEGQKREGNQTSDMLEASILYTPLVSQVAELSFGDDLSPTKANGNGSAPSTPHSQMRRLEISTARLTLNTSGDQVIDTSQLQEIYVATLRQSEHQAQLRHQIELLEQIKRQADEEETKRVRHEKAIQIQKLWRGYLVRKQLRAEIEQIQANLIAYRRRKAEEEKDIQGEQRAGQLQGQGGQRLSGTMQDSMAHAKGIENHSIQAKWEEASAMLNSNCLYLYKVGLCRIDRFLEIYPPFIRSFVVEMDGLRYTICQLNASNQSTATIEVVDKLDDILHKILLSRNVDVRSKLIEEMVDLVEYLLHALFSFSHDQPTLVRKSATLLSECHRIDPQNRGFEKAQFYTRKGSERLSQYRRKLAKLGKNSVKQDVDKALAALEQFQQQIDAV